MEIFHYISKMKILSKRKIIFFRPELLSKFQTRLINDISFNQVQKLSSSNNNTPYDLNQQRKFKKFANIITYRQYRKMILEINKKINIVFNCKNKLVNQILYKHLNQFLTLLPIFNSLHPLYIIWEFIIFIFANINFIYIPLQYAFQLNHHPLYNFYILYLCPIVFGFDIFIRANTQYYEKGSLIETHENIFKKYIKERFFFDIISVLSLNHNFLGYSQTQFLFFLRVSYSFKIVDIIREQFLLRVQISGVIQLFLLFAQLLYICHIFSCVWYAVGNYGLNFNEGWLVYYKLQQQSKLALYLQCFYYSVITMTTTGYGDIAAQSGLERLIVIMFALISCGQFGYTLNSIGNILYDFKLKNDQFLQQLAQMNKYFKYFNVDLSLQDRARKYIEYIYSDSIVDNNISAQSLTQLSQYLQQEIKTDVYMKIINKVKVFKLQFSQEFLKALTQKMKENVYSPDEIIMKEGKTQEPCVYFINSGSVISYYQKDNIQNEIVKLKDGDVFGFDNFFQESYDVVINMKSLGISSIICLGLGDFQEVLLKFEDQREIFCYLKDLVKFNFRYDKIQQKCFSCNQQNHLINSCPYLFYGQQKLLIINGYLQGLKTNKHRIDRSQRRTALNSLQIQQFVLQKQIQFQIQNEDLISDLEIDSFSDTSYLHNSEDQSQNDDADNQFYSDEHIKGDEEDSYESNQGKEEEQEEDEEQIIQQKELVKQLKNYMNENENEIQNQELNLKNNSLIINSDRAKSLSNLMGDNNKQDGYQTQQTDNKNIKYYTKILFKELLDVGQSPEENNYEEAIIDKTKKLQLRNIQNKFKKLISKQNKGNSLQSIFNSFLMYKQSQQNTNNVDNSLKTTIKNKTAEQTKKKKVFEDKQSVKTPTDINSILQKKKINKALQNSQSINEKSNQLFKPDIVKLIQMKKTKGQIYDIEDFDLLKFYQLYFPEHNPNKIISAVNIANEANKSKLQKFQFQVQKSRSMSKRSKKSIYGKKSVNSTQRNINF